MVEKVAGAGVAAAGAAAPSSKPAPVEKVAVVETVAPVQTPAAAPVRSLEKTNLGMICNVCSGQ